MKSIDNMTSSDIAKLKIAAWARFWRNEAKLKESRSSAPTRAAAGANAGCAGWPGRVFGLNEARQGIDVGQLPRKEIALLRSKPSKAWPMS